MLPHDSTKSHILISTEIESEFERLLNELKPNRVVGFIEDDFKIYEKASLNDITDFIRLENVGRCIQLVNKNMSAYREIVYGILKLNKLKVRKEARRAYSKTQRERYDELVNVSYMIL